MADVKAFMQAQQQAQSQMQPALAPTPTQTAQPEPVPTDSNHAEPTTPYVYLVGNTLGLFTARKQSSPKICDIRQAAKEAHVGIAWVDRYGKSRDAQVHQQATEQGDVPINSWVIDKRLWEQLLSQYNTELNNAGITAHEVK
jgi:hypothetical protein